MRYSYLLGSILILFFAPMNVLAAKGCCSGHGGVDCTKIQQDERVVCNDGWLGSSCTYQSMDKCRGYNPTGNNQGTSPTKKPVVPATPAPTPTPTPTPTSTPTPTKTPQVTPTPNIIYGCTDEQAINYNKLATVDNNSCRYEEENGNLLGTIALLGGGGAAAYYFIKKKKKTTQS